MEGNFLGRKCLEGKYVGYLSGENYPVFKFSEILYNSVFAIGKRTTLLAYIFAKVMRWKLRQYEVWANPFFWFLLREHSFQKHSQTAKLSLKNTLPTDERTWKLPSKILDWINMNFLGRVSETSSCLFYQNIVIYDRVTRFRFVPHLQLSENRTTDS